MGEAAPPAVGHGDVTGFWEALGDSVALSGLTVALYLTSLEKAKYRDPCSGLMVLGTKGAWGNRALGLSSISARNRG